MPVNTQRKEFLVFIIGEILSYMGLDVYLEGNTDKVTIIYEHVGKVKVVKYTTFERLLKFCDIGHLYNKLSTMEETKFIESIAKSKYFNTNMFEIEQNKSIFKEAKEYGLKDLFISFISYIFSNRYTLKKENYMFTTHERLLIRAIDYFFRVNIEETLDGQFESMKDALLSPEKIEEYILERKGKGYTIPDGAIRDCINELIDNVEASIEGGIEAYLRDSSMDTIKNDVQTIYQYYVLRDYNLSY